MSRCPTEEELARLVEGKASDAEREVLQAHLDECASCRMVVASALSRFDEGDGGGGDCDHDEATGPTVPVAGSGGGAGTVGAAPPARLPRGTLIGRYVVIDRLGAGGMGTVYAAFDPVLDRRVALKLLRPEVIGVEGQALLLREAKVLASFGHPNVLTVHDSGTFGERVFLAMELVDGGTLRDWARERPRSWREVVAMMATVGEGLAAAHRAGFVHRDFKPENVLVGRDGRPRITDFGLALRTGPGSDAGAALGSGTPLFMAPEQMAGEAPDARSDLFAFGVTLYWLCYGVRPFAGATIGELRAAILDDAVVTPPRDRRVPAWLRALTLRCLRADPSQRPASMEEVLAALRSDPGRRRARLLGVAGVALVAVGLGVTGARVAARRAESCAAEGRLPESVWGAPRRAALEQSFFRTGLAYARATANTTTRLLDEYAGAWTAMRVEACEATRVRRQQPEEIMALRVRCLEDRSRELAALASVLVEADRATVEQGPAAASALTPIADCADTVALARPVPRPRDPAVNARLEAELSRADVALAMLRTGRPGTAVELATGAAAALRTIGHAPSLSFAEYVAAMGEQRLGRADKAMEHMRESLVAAQQGRDDWRVLVAMEALTQITGIFLGRTEEGLFWSRLSFATLDRLPSNERETTDVRAYRFLVLSAAGRLEEAFSDARAVLAGCERDRGPRHLETSEARSNLGVVLYAMGRFEEARAQFADAVAGFESVHGVGNPEVLPARGNLGMALLTLGRTAEAAPLIESSLEESRAAYGEQGNYFTVNLINAGQLRIAQGRFDEAAAMERRAVAIYEKEGVSPSALCEPLSQVALAELGAGRAAAALPPAERALRLATEQGLPPVELAKVQLAAARVLAALGRERERARTLAASARDAWAEAARRFGGENHQRVEEIEAFLATLR